MTDSASSTPANLPPLRPIGVVRSELKNRKGAPRGPEDGAPDAWIDLEPWALEAMLGVEVSDKLLVLTWLHEGRREVLQVYPRDERGLTGVFATRSPDRPNPVGLHPVTVLEIDGARLKVSAIEAIDGTPVIDLKPDRC